MSVSSSFPAYSSRNEARPTEGIDTSKMQACVCIHGFVEMRLARLRVYIKADAIAFPANKYLKAGAVKGVSKAIMK